MSDSRLSRRTVLKYAAAAPAALGLDILKPQFGQWD